MSLPSTRYLYLRWPLCFMKHGWTNSFNLFFNLERGIVVLRVEKSNVLMLLQEESDLDCMYSNRSLEFLRVYI
jgi:hypothetical protein